MTSNLSTNSTLVDRLLERIVSWLARRDFSSLARLGAILGWLWFHLLPIRLDTLLNNLERTAIAKGSLARRLARRNLNHLCTTALETAWLSRATPEEVRSLMPIEHLERYHTAAAAGHGVIVATAHLGNFDLLACSQVASGVPLAIVSRDLGRGAVSRLWMCARTRFGLTIFEHGKDGRKVLAWLRQGNVLGLTVDQRQGPRQGGALVSLLGVPAWTSTAAARLSLRTGALILPVCGFRRENGTHTAVVHPPLEPLPTETAEQLTARLNLLVSEWIAHTPEQWLWIHRRFR